MQKKEKQIWTKSSSWILPAANCWFYFLSQLQVHSCLWVLWNPSIIVIPNFSLFSCQVKFLLKEAQITQRQIWTMGSFIPKTTNPVHKPYCSEYPLALPTDGSPSLIYSLHLRSMLAVNLQCPCSLTRVFSVLLPRSFLLFWNISVKLLCILSWSETAHCQKMLRIWYSVTPSNEFLTLNPFVLFLERKSSFICLTIIPKVVTNFNTVRIKHFSFFGLWMSMSSVFKNLSWVSHKFTRHIFSD